ncbi:hypothetical protein PR048_011193 [Dryococelus australis]|uniref:Mutator-like transposase domain-containing protein n=1 Tax=Dryococelus australis TaxID=614101 RepID=A0ABQ9HKX8_9NEOP|nr:hypothetical protein PR048_011193 [Dryococelus australis]
MWCIKHAVHFERNLKANHDRISDAIHRSAWELMAEATKEEVRLAIQAGDVDKEGHPMISVVTDGAWSTSSYKTKYNSLSGGYIIGYKTKKVLFIGVRNKYCTVCDITLPQVQKVVFQLTNVPKIGQDRPSYLSAELIYFVYVWI